jgi:putative glutamine amidotransferase
METTDAVVKPVIGLSTYLEHADTAGCGRVSAAFLPETYLAPLIAAGGIPALLPPQPVLPGVVEALVGRLDGLLIPGGWDVDPALYGQEPHPATDAPHIARDAWEQALIREALRQDIPLLCICRGAQLLNVTLGGTLHQHLPDVIGHGEHQPGNFTYNVVPVDVRPDSRLAGLLGTGPQQVPVSHHQAVDRLGDGLAASAWSAEQVVEAIELPAAAFAVGTQWHPEELDEDFGLFRGFIEAARAKYLSRLIPAAPTSAPAAAVSAVEQAAADIQFQPGSF